MPALVDSGPTDVAAFVNWLYGKENNADSNIAAVAKFAQANTYPRPSSPSNVKWQSLSDMRYIASVTGPSATNSQFDTALAAYVAS